MKFFAEGLPRLGVVNLRIYFKDDAIPDYSRISTTAGNYEAILLIENGVSQVVLPLAPSKTEILTPQISNQQCVVRITSTPTDSKDEPSIILTAEEIQSKWAMGCKFSCQSCHREIVRSEAIRWRDLPSDSWLEFADHWLCHRPNSHLLDSHLHTHQAPLPVSIAAKPGLGLVGLTSILIHQSDLENIETKV